MHWPTFSIQPEIISIHIPKTAGSSFHAILKAHYGWRLKHIQRQVDIATWSSGKPYLSNKPFVKAVHGHIRPHANWRKYYPEAKWVCWLRNPEARTLSAYYHLQKTQQLGDKNQQLFARLQPTLGEFVQNPAFNAVTRIYTRFLGAFAPEDFAFIGRTEHFEEDLQRFAALIGTHHLPAQRLNTGSQSTDAQQNLSPNLAALLSDEYEIYHRFVNAFYP